MTHPLATFVDIIARRDAPWRSADLRIVAVLADGAWRNVITQCYIRSHPSPRAPHQRVVFETPMLRGVRIIGPIALAVESIEAIVRGALPTVDGPVLYQRGQFQSSNSMPYGFADYHRHDLEYRHHHPAFTWGGHVLAA